MDNDRFKFILERTLSRNQDVLFNRLTTVLKPIGRIPKIGDTYFFMYKSNKTHDRYPLVTVYSLNNNCFIGYSHHWNRITQYSYSNIISDLYIVNDNELKNVMMFPVMKVVN